jgi:hypothetical protein
MRGQLKVVVALVLGGMQLGSLGSPASAQAPSQAAGGTMQLPGRWVATEHVTFTNPALAGSAFYLDVVVAPDGTFQGTWDTYTCLSYPGPYSTTIISCSRVKRPAKARGKLDATAGTGEIQLDGLGRSAFTYRLGTELLLELPKSWARQNEPVLYTSKLARASK